MKIVKFRKNNFRDFLLSLTTGMRMDSVEKESSFRIRQLKNKMINILDNGR